MKRNKFAASLCVTWLWITGAALITGHAMAGQPESSGPGSNTMLHVAGRQIVDGTGKPVQLRGVNVGGWLNWEGWMFGEGFLSETEIMKGLSTLAGADAAEAFRRGIYSNYIAAADFRKIAELGFNSVRVPINYRLLDGTANGAADQAAGWQILDQMLDWCDQYHLYAVLDLHAAPGGQTRLFTADPDRAGESLWQSTAHQQQTGAFWSALASRYNSRRCIAGFDLINEPSSPSGQQWPDLCRELVKSVRARDTNHILFVEGNSLATDFSMFASPPDANMVYSFHMYTWFGDNRRRKLAAYQAFAGEQNVPLWVGEFGENNYEMIGSTVKMFDEHPEICGWSFWPWKRAPSRSPGLVTVNVPTEWQNVMAWINHPLLRQKPDAATTREAMAAFLEAVKLDHAQLNGQMVQALLPSTTVK